MDDLTLSLCLPHMMNEARPSPFLLYHSYISVCIIVNANQRIKNERVHYMTNMIDHL